jgi:hypothetical protein
MSVNEVGHGKLKVEPYISASKKRTPDSDEPAADSRIKIAKVKRTQKSKVLQELKKTPMPIITEACLVIE